MKRISLLIFMACYILVSWLDSLLLGEIQRCENIALSAFVAFAYLFLLELIKTKKKRGL